LTPVMAVGINIPAGHPVAGMVFTAEFLSTQGTDRLAEPFGGELAFPENCGDPETERIYARLVEEVLMQVSQGSFDEETSYKVQGIIDFADSISLAP